MAVSARELVDYTPDLGLGQRDGGVALRHCLWPCESEVDSLTEPRR